MSIEVTGKYMVDFDWSNETEYETPKLLTMYEAAIDAGHLRLHDCSGEVMRWIYTLESSSDLINELMVSKTPNFMIGHLKNLIRT